MEPLLDRLLVDIPAIMLVGPRAVGKTTLARSRAASIVRLDVEAEAAVARLDPDRAVSGLAEPVLIDEWQNVPEILPAIKRAVDADPRGGRFLLTGSVDADTAPGTWAGTGRVVNVPLWGLSVAEQFGRGEAESFVDKIIGRKTDAAHFARSTLTLSDYLDLALASGYPQPALALSGEARDAWLASYIDQLVVRDVASLGERNPTLLRRYLRVLALNSAGVVTQATLLAAADVNSRTARGYEDDLQRVYALELVEAWHSNRLSRLAKLPKRYLADAALIPAALSLRREDIGRDADLIGRVLDTFVASQLRAQLGIRVPQPRLHHLRDQDGAHEIDLLFEAPDGVYAFEVKAASSLDRRDARHLSWLRDKIGDQFRLGVVFSPNPSAVRLGDRLLALPISALWG